LSGHLIIAPPPTPNGDLHVGHLAGPYLAADIYKRYLAQHGIRAHLAISTDDHQTYVDTTAHRLGLSRGELIARSREEIRESLLAYSIELDEFGSPDAAYRNHVVHYFATLLKAGLIRVANARVLFDLHTESYPVEAFVAGYCPHCLDSACGGVCESCGCPNSNTDLLGLDCDRYEIREEPRLTLDLESFRPTLDTFLNSMTTHRPALHHLIRELLARPLPPFSLSYKTGVGIDTSFADLPDQQLNVWGEMYVGHMHFLERALGRAVSAHDSYVQFLGFDNSYFYVFVHVALAIAADKCGFDWPKPAAFLTNQFYCLSDEKFSTSRRHLIWSRELTVDFNPDLIRLYLALHGPELQEASFELTSFESAASRMATCINELVDAYNLHGGSSWGSTEAFPTDVVLSMRNRIDLRDFSPAIVARRAMNCVRYITKRMARSPGDWMRFVPAALVLCLEPFCPRYTDAVRAQCAIGRENRWGALHRSSPDAALPCMSVKP
jgi:methionyl-tRNA synthetase